MLPEMVIQFVLFCPSTEQQAVPPVKVRGWPNIFAEHRFCPTSLPFPIYVHNYSEEPLRPARCIEKKTRRAVLRNSTAAADLHDHDGSGSRRSGSVREEKLERHGRATRKAMRKTASQRRQR